MTDKQALREAAEKALPAMKRLLMMPNDELFDEALLNVDGDVDAANAFNLLTGPETVLALLDELEADKKRIAELEAREVTLPAQKFCPDEYVGSVLWAESEIWNQAISECAKAIRAAGIGKEA